jgi:hypothetical protein
MVEKESKIKSAIEWVKKRGFTDIKANVTDDEDIETPSSFERKKDDESFVPDISGKKLGAKSYFELAIKTDETRRLVTKWKLLSKMAALKNGKLYLLAPRGSKSFTDDLVKTYNIQAKVYSI